MNFLVSCATINFLFFANIVSSSVNITAKYDVDTAQNTIIYIPRTSFTLTCNVSTDDNNVEIKWEKNGIPLSDIEELNGRTHPRKKNDIYTLKIDKSTENDAGNYTCNAYVDNKLVKSATIIAASKVKVKTPANVNVVEGEKLRIHCVIIGSPPIEITWTIGNETYKESRDRVQLLDDTEKKIPNAILLIEDIQMSDRGYYTCMARSNVTLQTDSHASMVRIKDKYAALWPFLGICAEVFVLCAIILIYEKKRNKTELEESDTDQSPDQKNTPDHGKDSNLRHRQ